MVQNQFMFYYLMPQKHSIKLNFKVFFNELRDRSLFPKIIKLLFYMYANQECSVRWGSEHFDFFMYQMVLNKEELYPTCVLVVTLINCSRD